MAILLTKEEHNYIVFDNYGKIKEKNLHNITAGSSGIEIYILAEFDNNEVSEYQAYANIKRPDGLVVGDIVLEQLAEPIEFLYGTETIVYSIIYYGRKLTLYDDVTQLQGAIQLSIVFSKFANNYLEIERRIMGQIVMDIYDAVNFYTPRSSVIKAMMKYVDQQALGGESQYQSLEDRITNNTVNANSAIKRVEFDNTTYELKFYNNYNQLVAIVDLPLEHMKVELSEDGTSLIYTDSQLNEVVIPLASIIDYVAKTNTNNEFLGENTFIKGVILSNELGDGGYKDIRKRLPDNTVYWYELPAKDGIVALISDLNEVAATKAPLEHDHKLTVGAPTLHKARLAVVIDDTYANTDLQSKLVRGNDLQFDNSKGNEFLARDGSFKVITAQAGGLTYGAKVASIPIGSPEPSAAPDIPATAQVVYITPIPRDKTTHSVLDTKIIPLSEIGSGVSQAVKLGYDDTDSRVYKGNENTKLWVEWYEGGLADTHDLVIYFQ